MKTVIIDLKSVKSTDSKHSSEWSYPWAKTGVSKLSVKGQIVNILGFVGPLVSVAVTQLCCNENSHQQNMQVSGHGCIPVKLHLQRQAVG